MQPNFSEDLSSCHSRLCDLESELRKERNSLIENYNVGIYYHSYYPMLKKYSTFVDQYVMGLANFKKLLQVSLQQQQQQQQQNNSSINNINGQEENNKNSTTDNNNNNNDVNTQREFAVIENNNNMNNMNNMNDDMKQNNNFKPQPQPSERRKPPVKSSNISLPISSNIPIISVNKKLNKMNIINANIPIITVNKKKNVQKLTVNRNINSKPQNIKPIRSRQIVVARHKYRHSDKDFQIFWKRNFQRPMYTLTTVKINKSFSGKEREVKKYLYERGGFKPELIEQITAIYNNNNRKLIDFWLIRYRASLSYIYKCIEKIDLNEGKGIVIKQNNRSKFNNRNNINKSQKLYVTNFDILDKNCHIQLTNIFNKFGELERDIFIGKDKKTRNPYAKVEFREVNDAITCMKTHSNFNSTIYFPIRKNNNNQNDNNNKNNYNKFLNRKLRIEYNIPRDNTFNKNKSKNKNRNNNTRR